MLEIEAKSYDGTPLNQHLSARFDQKGGTLGRSDDNRLVLQDPQKHVSRVHAEVVYADDGYYLVCRSANRLIVNQVELEQGARRLLHEGDALEIGSYQLTVRMREGTGPGTSPFPVPTQAQPGPLKAPSTTVAPPALMPASMLAPANQGRSAPTPPVASPPHDLADPLGLDDVLADFGIIPATPTNATGDAPSAPGVQVLPEYQPRLSSSAIDWNAPPEFDKGLEQAPVFSAPSSPTTPVMPGASIDDIWGDLSDAAEINPVAGGPLDLSSPPQTRTDARPHPLSASPDISLAAPSSATRPAGPPAPELDFDDPLAAFDLSDDDTPAGSQASGAARLAAPIPDSDLTPADASPPHAADIRAPAGPQAWPAAESVPAAAADDPLGLELDSLIARQSQAPRSPSASEPADSLTPDQALQPSPVSQARSRDALMTALAQGLSMPAFDLPERMTPEFARLLGKLLHESINGTLDLVNARAQARKEIRADLTMISPKRANNPLKHAPTAEVALKRLLSPTEAGYMPGATALREAYLDIQSHHMGFMAGMQATLTSVLNRLRPDRIETLLGDSKGMDAIVPNNRRARAWTTYQEHYQTVATEVTNEFHAQLGKEFLSAYEAQVARAKSQNSSSGG